MLWCCCSGSTGLDTSVKTWLTGVGVGRGRGETGEREGLRLFGGGGSRKGAGVSGGWVGGSEERGVAHVGGGGQTFCGWEAVIGPEERMLDDEVGASFGTNEQPPAICFL